METAPAPHALPSVDGDQAQAIDLALTRCAVLTDGSRIAVPKHLRLRPPAVAGACRNVPHQRSRKLTSENQAFFAETLNVQGLARTGVAAGLARLAAPPG
ncbi:hypothetical protein ACWC2T_06555 [Streptomyces sp. NPDC001393]